MLSFSGKPEHRLRIARSFKGIGNAGIALQK